MAPAAIYIDNLNRMLASGKLAAALTAREYSDRVLGSSEQVSLPVRCVWVATANNPTLSTEISRRCIRIRIDPRVDEPWKRDGFKHAKLRSWVEAHRGNLIWAALVMCRYGLQHGAAGPALGSYEAWSDVLGRILQGAGINGFLGNLDMLYARADAEGAAWRALVGAWWEQHQDKPKAAGDLFPLVAEVEADMLVNGRDDVGRKKSFGKALARVLERVFTVETDKGPLRLQVAEDGVRHKAKLWQLAPVESGGIGGLGGLFQRHARTKNFLDAGAKENPQNTHNPHLAIEDLPLRDIGQMNRAKPDVQLPASATTQPDGLLDDALPNEIEEF
jgi:putative DNA primase/helicase